MTLAPHHRPTTDLDDRYIRESGTVLLGGIAALVRMIRDRALLDRALLDRDLLDRALPDRAPEAASARAHTASFISGYEGSPLAGFDLELARREALLTVLTRQVGYAVGG